MASQFESLIHPLIILFTVPLAMVGVILSLVVTRTDISVMVLLGAIILVGIVVNNAIVLGRLYESAAPVRYVETGCPCSLWESAFPADRDDNADHGAGVDSIGRWMGRGLGNARSNGNHRDGADCCSPRC